MEDVYQIIPLWAARVKHPWMVHRCGLRIWSNTSEGVVRSRIMFRDFGAATQARCPKGLGDEPLAMDWIVGRFAHGKHRMFTQSNTQRLLDRCLRLGRLLQRHRLARQDECRRLQFVRHWLSNRMCAWQTRLAAGRARLQLASGIGNVGQSRQRDADVHPRPADRSNGLSVLHRARSPRLFAERSADDRSLGGGRDDNGPVPEQARSIDVD